MVDSATARKLLSSHGVTRAQDSTDWKGSFALPLELEAFYREVGPVDVSIDGYGNPYFLPSLLRLWEYQAGYRWNSATGEPAAGWDDDWIVVAVEGGDPFIFSRAGGGVLRANHGTGAWTVTEIFDDVNAMAACLATLGGVVVAAGDALLDDDFNVRTDRLEAAAQEIAKLLGSEARALDVLHSLGWTS